MKKPKSEPPCTTPFPGVDGDGTGVAPTRSSGPGLNLLSDQDAGDGTDVGEPEAATNGTIANDDVTSGISIMNRRRVFHTG